MTVREELERLEHRKLNPLAAFAGIMGLKAGAYLQPFTHKISTKFKRR